MAGSGKYPTQTRDIGPALTLLQQRAAKLESGVPVTAAERAAWNGAVATVAEIAPVVAGMTPSDTVTTQAFSDAPNAGASDSYSRADHKHGMMAAPVIPDVTGTIIAMAIALG
jgi:hypothetical protein